MALNITTQDIVSATATGQAAQPLITGAPTPASFQQVTTNGTAGLGIQIAGTWTGTLAFEKSMDGGTTWAAVDAILQGIDSIVQSVTGNCIATVNAAAGSQVRVRATAAMTGTAAVTFLGNVVGEANHHIVVNNTKSALNIIAKNPTVTAGAYSANNGIGGIQTLTGAVRKPNGYATLQSINIMDAAAQGAQQSIFLFKALPTGGTYADHGALVLAAADLPNFLGKVDILAANADPLGTATKVQTASAIGLPVQGDASGNVYALMTTTGTPTYTALCLTYTFGFEQA